MAEGGASILTFWPLPPLPYLPLGMGLPQRASRLLLTEQDHRVRQLSVNMVTFNDPGRHIHVFICTRRDGC